MNLHQNYYLKFLDVNDKADPLSVIAQFFSSDWLPGHLKALAIWRKYLLSDEVFEDGRSGPANVLFTYEITIKLLEAVFLFSKTKRFRLLKDRIYLKIEDQIEQERREWIHYPGILDFKGLANPYEVILQVLERPLDDYNDQLHEWLEIALSTSSIDESLSVADFIWVYESIQKLYEASWVIRQREITLTLKKDTITRNNDLKEANGRTENNLVIYQTNCSFNIVPTIAELAGLEKLTDKIVSSIENVDLIIHLGTYPRPEAYYLLILVSENNKTTEHELVNRIEDLCKPMIDVCALVHKFDAFIRAINGENNFFYNALLNRQIAYQSKDFVIPAVKNFVNELTTKTTEETWKRWGMQGKSFFEAAQRCYEEGNYNLSLFLIHQAVENALSVIIRLCLGYRISIHNLARMLRITQIFTDDFKNVFDYNVAEDICLFKLLQSAYSAARYVDNFNVDKDSVNKLLKRVSMIIDMAEALYTKLIEN
ncbi:HEPN domain-containing protein [Mucilaginibacter ginkgonis]|uniref:HEPN domain-containing protein n=1 Tax=Mucilaginibacter ginkgonis TaxID=2682091 RepID=A0A6I4HXV4_9SPHI|nr:HEPN domain-containing protein [Mucilaginibacter ginkgonis]QQL51202.1 HEPN domain-containing protein [Mucilaginibacter ginkgonis]